MRATFRGIGLAWALGVAAGCGSDKPATITVKTTRVEDPVNGYRISIPEGWVVDELPQSDLRRRWFSGRWKPAGAALPVEGLFVHLMSPGCAASDLGGRFGGAPFATEVEPEGYSVVSSSPASAGTRSAFRIVGRYLSKKLGELFESSIYIETEAGSGVLITSRGAPGNEAVVRARLEAALAGFELLKREVRLKPANPHAGGITLSIPEGFDEQFGPAAYGSIAFAVGPIGVQARQESITLIIAPPVPAGAQFLATLLGEASKGLTRGAPRRMKVAGQEVQGVTLSPPDTAPRYEVAVTMFRLGDLSAAVCVHAAMIPNGRALDLLEAVATSISIRLPDAPKLEPVRFGESRVRASLAPTGWEVRKEDAVLTARFYDPVAAAPQTGTNKVAAILIEATIEEDSRGNGTPGDAARDFASGVTQKKGRVVSIDDFRLPDGRPAARLVAATQVSFEFLLFVRTTPGSLAHVHVSSTPGFAPIALKIGEDALAATKFVPLAEMSPPSDAVLEASRKLLQELLEKTRNRPAAIHWYIVESGGAETGGQRIQIEPEGSWVDREMRTAKFASVENTIKASPGRYSATLTATHAPANGAKPVVAVTSSRIESMEGDRVSVIRKRGDGDEQKVVFARPDLWLPPDAALSDGMIVAIGSAPQGGYAFATVDETYLFLRWKEFRVLGEEDVEVPAGKYKARRVEVGNTSIYWVAEGKVVKAELGDISRKLCPEETVKKYFKD